MLRAYRSDDVRQAEAPLLERGVPLMDRAAAALATEVIRRVRALGNRVPGTEVLGLGWAAEITAATSCSRWLVWPGVVCPLRRS